MYNKIASIILNSGKNTNYAGEVFVSQPDASRERLAGKIFVLAEIEGKKNETQKIINFLVNIFDYNYYGDEKILLRDKVEGLKIENIFETVLARVNQGLVDFLQEEHIKINPANTNLTLGVVFEDKLYFSNYGKNKAFLVYRRRGDYEMINVESSVTEGEAVALDESFEAGGSKIFSAVINGEIPAHSYFLFTNEALPEYLSNRELINIITKLPPMVAAEQIKNHLQKINSFAPFLGIIVKSTIGTISNDAHEIIDENETSHQVAGAALPRRSSGNRNAHSSISHLNYTEAKTESMLAPAGIINFKKIIKGAGNLLSKFKVEIPENKKVVKFYEDNDETVITQAAIPVRETKRPDLARRDSFMIKDKLVFRKTSLNILPKIGSVLQGVAIIFMPRFWTGIYQGLSSWIKGLGKKDRILVGALALCFLILLVSIIYEASNNKVRLATEKFNQVVTNINNTQAQIDLYAAVGSNDEASGALNVLIDSLKNSLPQNKDQESQKANLLIQLAKQSDKIQKITEISSFQELVSTTAWNAQAKGDNLVYLNNNLYISDGTNKAIYDFNLKDSTRGQITLTDTTVLTSPTIGDTNIYYLAGQKIVKVTGQTASTLNIGSTKLQGENFIQFYNGIYLMSKTDNQIYKYNAGLSSRSSWFKAPVDLGKATDFKIDGAITISQNGDDLLKFYSKERVEYKTTSISPAISADKVIVTATNVYLLDIKNSRLIVLKNEKIKSVPVKEGALIKQYRLVKDNIKDFAIDEAGKAGYILAGTSVYKFGL